MQRGGLEVDTSGDGGMRGAADTGEAGVAEEVEAVTDEVGGWVAVGGVAFSVGTGMQIRFALGEVTVADGFK